MDQLTIEQRLEALEKNQQAAEAAATDKNSCDSCTALAAHVKGIYKMIGVDPEVYADLEPAAPTEQAAA